jgi:hypothetical protein
MDDSDPKKNPEEEKKDKKGIKTELVENFTSKEKYQKILLKLCKNLKSKKSATIY